MLKKKYTLLHILVTTRGKPGGEGEYGEGLREIPEAMELQRNIKNKIAEKNEGILRKYTLAYNRFDTNPIKFIDAYLFIYLFAEIVEFILKVSQECQGSRTATINNDKGEGTTHSEFRTVRRGNKETNQQ